MCVCACVCVCVHARVHSLGSAEMFSTMNRLPGRRRKKSQFMNAENARIQVWSIQESIIIIIIIIIIINIIIIILFF